ncbi:PREDICTED: lymphocyte function-associated antigen 3 [Miniopterus natalensis]|uniref:lymphocyte function-associated antigen 3 n=1 Tax=Miniopterus natalensis TaxID=291302 RepID=UPI0007A6B4D0|nr:PREDICTED: lymphocyte function-associated antigen 3 [Miniopterus natalensis]
MVTIGRQQKHDFLGKAVAFSVFSTKQDPLRAWRDTRLVCGYVPSIAHCTWHLISLAHKVAGECSPLHLTLFSIEHLGRWFSVLDSHIVFPNQFFSPLLDLITCKSTLQYGIVNGNVTLSPSSTVDFTEIIWKKGQDKIAEWSRVLTKVKRYGPLAENVDLDPKSGNLVISNLTSLAEGEFEIESVDLKKGLKFRLIVLDPLPFPTLNCTLTNESIDIHCEVPDSYNRHRDLLTYWWYCPSAPCNKSSMPGASSPGISTVLQFKKSDDLSQEVYCYVKNLVFVRTSSVVLSTCVVRDNSRTRYVILAAPVVCIVTGLIIFASKRGRASST